MKTVIYILIAFLITLSVGVFSDYFEVNRYIKFAMMIAAMVFTLRLLGR